MIRRASPCACTRSPGAADVRSIYRGHFLDERRTLACVSWHRLARADRPSAAWTARDLRPARHHAPRPEAISTRRRVRDATSEAEIGSCLPILRSMLYRLVIAPLYIVHARYASHNEPYRLMALRVVSTEASMLRRT